MSARAAAGPSGASPLAEETGTPRRSSMIKDGPRPGKHLKKTVSFGSMPGESKISSVIGCLSRMQEGGEFSKLRPGLRLYNRYYLLEADRSAIRWVPSKKDAGKARLLLRDVCEVRTGRNTDVFRTSGASDFVSEDRAFSVIHSSGSETLDLVASSAEVANIWVTGLRYLISPGSNAHPDTPAAAQDDTGQLRLSWLSESFAAAGGACGRLSVAEATELMRRLSPWVKASHVEQRLRELLRDADAPPHTHVTLQHFARAFHDLCTCPEVYFLLANFSGNKDFLDVRDVMCFLETEQGAARDSAQQVIDRYEPSPEARRLGRLYLDGLTRFLQSPECCLFDSSHARVCQDMTRPLSHYYISSSHNTHLTDAQVRGVSGVAGYVRALRLGCRCLELDVWEGPEGQPVVCKGHTHTRPPSFASVMEVVGRLAFAVSEFPLILCIENHCSADQQRIMVRHLQDSLGERLHQGLLGNGEEGPLPSPAALKGRVLLLGNRPVREEGAERAAASRRVPLCAELSELMSLCHSDAPPADLPRENELRAASVTCFKESLAARHAGERPGDVVELAKRSLLRVRPSLMRVDSSNPNPLDFWKAGFQLVGVNVQTPGAMLDLHRGWFRMNGGCGYALRPSLMRQEVAYFRSNSRGALPGVTPQTLHVRVISGRCLPKPRGAGAKGDVVDPYVSVEIYGIPADCAEHRTRTVPHNGESPVFDQSFEFQVNLPELALLRLLVLDDDFIADDFIGQYTLPLDCMQTGFRHVPLLSADGEELPHARLLVHVAMTERRGGGKAHKRGLSVRRGRRGRSLVQPREIGLKSTDEVFRAATPPLRHATNLRENVQDSVESFKELCGVSALSNITQCVLALGSRVVGSEVSLPLQFELTRPYPQMVAQKVLPDSLRRVPAAYDAMIEACKALIEQGDDIHSKILHTHNAAMEFHENLHHLATSEGFKGRKVNRILESFTWNITILKGQADLLLHAKSDAQELMKQLHCALLTTGLCVSAQTDAGPGHTPDGGGAV
ncbi:inactive phospholipase C-like protein 2 [Denticeps clupeoides]|nr:inactive phospholipase C-like protein 2 [Denticeps clupeoides]